MVDYLVASDMEFNSYEEAYAERYARLRFFYREELSKRQAATNEWRDRKVAEALISMVPQLEAYLRELDDPDSAVYHLVYKPVYLTDIEHDWGAFSDRSRDW